MFSDDFTAGKPQDPQISNPINTQQVHSPWDMREEALNEEGDGPIGEGVVPIETETATQERAALRVEVREQQTQEDEETSSVRYSERENFINAERERRGHVEPASHMMQSHAASSLARSAPPGYRDFSGSVSSARYDYADSPEGWIPDRYRAPPESAPQTQPVFDGTGEDYVHMNSVTSNNMSLMPMLDMCLSSVLEECVREGQERDETMGVGGEDNFIATGRKFPADYEDPIPSQSAANIDPNPFLGHKGPTLSPAVSTVTATGSGSSTYDNPKTLSKKYININVSSLSSMVPPTHTSDSQPVSRQAARPLLVAQQQSSDRPCSNRASAESGSEEVTPEVTLSDRHPYVNIDEAFSPELLLFPRKYSDSNN